MRSLTLFSIPNSLYLNSAARSFLLLLARPSTSSAVYSREQITVLSQTNTKQQRGSLFSSKDRKMREQQHRRAKLAAVALLIAAASASVSGAFFCCGWVLRESIQST